MLNRLVRIFNVSAAVLAVLILFAAYWYGWRPLPRTSGQLRAPVSARASIRRDARGVPHIQAASWQDAIFLQGFAIAQDRLWQMDTLRRFAAGELAEVFGSAALGSDERSRAMRLRALAEANAARLAGDDFVAVVEYARGVNFFIESNRNRLPLEFALPGHQYDPRPWTPTDSMLVGLIMYRDLTDSSKSELDKGRLLEKADAAWVRSLFPAVQGAEISPGSNAWALSGAHTASGKPLLANDPHLAYGIPGTWHLVHLEAPGLHVTGAALPGIPCVIAGHNDRIAWGVTNMQTDVMDLYREQIDLRTGRYQFQGRAEQAILDRQAIGVRGAKTVELNTWITRHGPVVSRNKDVYTMRWSATDGFSFPFLAIDRASNWEQFRAPLRDYFGPGQNFVYADRDGNIGYQATGRMPIRGDGKSFLGSDAPLDGAAGNAEWTGYIPFEQMPSLYNPPSGMIVTANQNPFPRNFSYQVPGSYADRYRVEQIRNLLSARNGWRAEEMLAVQKDVYSAYDRFLARQIVKAVERKKTNEFSEAVGILKRWNGQMEHDQPAPAITQAVHHFLAENLVMNYIAHPRGEAAKKVPAAKDAGKSQISSLEQPGILPRSAIIENFIREHDRDADPLLPTVLRMALSQERDRQGSNLRNWRWGRVLQWKFAHPIGKTLPLVDRFFDIGPVEMSGSLTTVKQTNTTIGPSERMIVDLANWERSLQNLPAGESGMVASKHYKDQWPAYYVGKSFPMDFGKVSASDVLTIVPDSPGSLRSEP